MAEEKFRVYGYRWVVLGAFMFLNLTIQMLWIGYAPITGPAAAFYGVTDAQIGLLAMIFMLVFIPLSIPVSWAIDTYGFHRAVGVGAALMAVFGVLRGLAGADFSAVAGCTVALAVAQPFLLNAWTKVPANWFSIRERATAVGLITLSSLLGVAVGMALTPVLMDGGWGIPSIQLFYGALAAVSAAAFLLLAREKPATPPCPPGMEVRALMLDGLKNALRNKYFWMYLFVMFVGMGIFNGVTTWVETIIRPRGFTPTDAGTLGALMLLGGVIGAAVIPPFSDREHKRIRYLLAGVLLAVPWLAALAFVTGPALLFLSGFGLGFFLISISPIGMQYAAEITHPTPEGTSNGLIQLAGQISVVFVYIMEALRLPDGSFTPSLLLGCGLLLAAGLMLTRMKDPPPHPA
jgi:MFS family permease